MDIPEFEELFKQIKTNCWIMGIPLDESGIKLRYFFFFILLSLTAIQEIAYFISNISPENFLELTHLAPCLCFGCLSILKIVMITLKRQRIFSFTNRLKLLYDKMLSDSNKREVVRRDFIFLKFLVKYYFILYIVVITVYSFSTPIVMLYHYYTKNLITFILPYAVLCPFSTDVWHNWLLVFVHSTCSGYFSIIFYTIADGLYFALTTHVCAQFALLGDDIKLLDKNTSPCLKAIVKKHQYILKLSEELEEFFQAINFFTILTGSIIICALGFNLTMGPRSHIPGVLLFLFSALIQILMVSVFGENLINESSKIGEAAFNCKWYDMDHKAKKIILLLTLRSNKPQRLTAYKFSIISYQSFTKIISSSWSYFTILKSAYTSPESVRE